MSGIGQAMRSRGFEPDPGQVQRYWRQSYSEAVNGWSRRTVMLTKLVNLAPLQAYGWGQEILNPMVIAIRQVCAWWP